MPQKLIKPFVSSLIAALVLYGIMTIATDYQKTGSAMGTLTADAWLLLLALIVVHLLLRFGRWQWYLRKLGHHIPWLPSLTYYLAGFALTTTPGKVGETLRSVYLKDEGVDYPSSLAAFFAERFTDLLAVATLAALAAAQFRDEAWPTLVLCLLILAALLLVRAPILPSYCERLAAKCRSERLASLFTNIAEGLQSSSRLLELPTLLISFLIALLAWAVQGGMLYVILQQMGWTVDPTLAIGIFCLALLVGVLSFIPGGLGSAEAVILSMLIATGIDHTNAWGATLLSRVSTLWFVVAIGCCALLTAEVMQRRKPSSTRRQDTTQASGTSVATPGGQDDRCKGDSGPLIGSSGRQR